MCERCNEQQNQDKKEKDQATYSYGSLTEQGNFGLGFDEIKNEKDKEEVKSRIQENWFLCNCSHISSSDLIHYYLYIFSKETRLKC